MKKHSWSIMMLLFAGILIYSTITNSLGHYIHPRFHFAVYLSILLLVVLSIEHYFRCRKQSSRPLKLGYVLFLIPLLVIFIPTNTSASTKIALSNGGMIRSIEEKYVAASFSPVTEEIKEEVVKKVDNTNSIFNKLYSTEARLLSALETLDNDIPFEVVEYNYLLFINTIHFNIEQVIGQKFSYIGMVYRDETLKEDELIIGRLMMYCCSADAQITGVLSQYDDAASYTNEEWVEVTGRLSMIDYYVSSYDKIMKVPYLKLEKIEIIDPPEDIYVYY